MSLFFTPKATNTEGGKEISCLCCGGSGLVHTRIVQKYLDPTYQDWDPPILCRAGGCDGSMATITTATGTIRSNRFGEPATQGMITELPSLDWSYLRATTQSQWIAATIDYLGQNGFYLQKFCDWVVQQETAVMQWYRTQQGQDQKVRDIRWAWERLEQLNKNFEMPDRVKNNAAIDVEVITHNALPPAEELEW